jgi:hypothetical protein
MNNINNPQVRSGRPILITGVAVLVTLVTVVAVAAFLQAGSAIRSPATTRSADRPSVEYTPPNPPVTLPPTYHEVVKEQVAQGLHLSVAQVVAKIQSNPDDGLYGVAVAGGVSQDQVESLALSAFRTAGDKMVSTGNWTRQQADQDIQYWSNRGSKALVGDITGWLLNP